MKREVLPRDGTLWLTSHRDSMLLYCEMPICQDMMAVETKLTWRSLLTFEGQMFRYYVGIFLRGDLSDADLRE